MTSYDAWVAEQQKKWPLYPWVPDANRAGPAWPRSDESKRLTWYATAEALVRGEGHFDEFELSKYASSKDAAQARKDYVVLNMLAPAVRAVQRVLAHQGPQFVSGDSPETLAMVGGERGLKTLAHQLLRSRLVYGDAALLVRVADGGSAWLEPQDVDACYPIPRADQRFVASEVRTVQEFAYRDGSGRTQRYLYIVAFRPEVVWHSLWRVDRGLIVEQVPLRTVPEAAALAGGVSSETQMDLILQHPVAEPLLLWSPRDALTDLDGYGLFENALQAQAMLGRRYTQRDRKLVCQDDGTLVMNQADAGWDADANDGAGGYTIRYGNSRALIRQTDGENIANPEWIGGTPDISANKVAADDALASFATLCGVSAASITQDPAGMVPESGTALRMRHRETIETATLEAMEIVDLLAHGIRLALWSGGSDPGPDAVKLEWKPGGMWAEEETEDLFAPPKAAAPATQAEEPAATATGAEDLTEFGL